MEPDDFFGLLSKTGKWTVSDDGYIRRCSDGACPIMAVYSDNYNQHCRIANDMAETVGVNIGMGVLFAREVIKAADGDCQSWVRNRILASIGGAVTTFTQWEQQSR